MFYQTQMQLYKQLLLKDQFQLQLKLILQYSNYMLVEFSITQNAELLLITELLLLDMVLISGKSEIHGDNHGENKDISD